MGREKRHSSPTYFVEEGDFWRIMLNETIFNSTIVCVVLIFHKMGAILRTNYILRKNDNHYFSYINFIRKEL